MNLISVSIAVFLAVFVVSNLSGADGRGSNPFKRCRGHGRYYYDNCRQRCYCFGRRPISCTRIRREYTTMTNLERNRYFKTIENASNIYKKEYRELIKKHYDLFWTDIHEKSQFLPWHRYYIWQFENLVRRVDCSFTVSYWDWSLMSTNPWKRTFPSPWSPSGMGGNGSSRDQCVTTGPFRRGQWFLPDYAGGGCLKRNFGGTTPNAIALTEVLKIDADDFDTFEMDLRGPIHDNVHCQFGGTMCTVHAASAPEFFLHHAMVDKIWADWQRESSAKKNAYFPKNNVKLENSSYYATDFIDINNHPGRVRVSYQVERKYQEVYKKLKAMSLKQLKNKPRLGFTGILTRTVNLFKLKATLLIRFQALEKTLQPSAARRLKKLPRGSTSMEQALGFQIKT